MINVNTQNTSRKVEVFTGDALQEILSTLDSFFEIDHNVLGAYKDVNSNIYGLYYQSPLVVAPIDLTGISTDVELGHMLSLKLNTDNLSVRVKTYWRDPEFDFSGYNIPDTLVDKKYIGHGNYEGENLTTIYWENIVESNNISEFIGLTFDTITGDPVGEQSIYTNML